MLISADHGNLEDMWDETSGQPNTQHSTNPVPLVYVGRKASLRSGGSLRDIAPTVLALMEMPQPPEMSGRSLVQVGDALGERCALASQVQGHGAGSGAAL